MMIVKKLANNITKLSLVLCILSCSYKPNIDNAELIVPPFIEDDNPELYKLLTTDFEKEKKSKNKN